MNLRRAEEPKADIDMTPMIDCVFLLLIFFMCAATMNSANLKPEIILPLAPKAAVPEDLSGRGVVNICPVGTEAPDGFTTEDSPFVISGRTMGERELTKVITQGMNQNPDMRVYMRVDRNSDFKLVKRAIKSCAEAGVFDIIFATTQTDAQ
jgi:biopolymer transport protein ExbD